MVYGDGVGFALADDVVAHELTHGVTEHTSNLFYYYQSGAINESLSDIWGEFVDQTNLAGNDSASVKWLIGEDVIGLGAIRDMEDPTTFGDPDRMTSPSYWFSMGDSGGVHTNSGINNKAAYLMVEGGSFNGQTVTALGITKVAAIYYEVQTNLLTSGADYADLHDALFQACQQPHRNGRHHFGRLPTGAKRRDRGRDGPATDTRIQHRCADLLARRRCQHGLLRRPGVRCGEFRNHHPDWYRAMDLWVAVRAVRPFGAKLFIWRRLSWSGDRQLSGSPRVAWSCRPVRTSISRTRSVSRLRIGTEAWWSTARTVAPPGSTPVRCLTRTDTAVSSPRVRAIPWEGARRSYPTAMATSRAAWIYPPLQARPSDFAGAWAWTRAYSTGAGGWTTCMCTRAPRTVRRSRKMTRLRWVADSVDNPLDVLANDTDPGDTLTITTVDTTGTVGTAVIDDNGTAADPTDDVIKYTPLPGFAGLDSFSYTIEDSGALSDTATVTVTVTPVGGGLVVDFNGYAIQSYGGSQDETPTAYAVEDGGATLHLMGNTWKAIELTPAYAVTPNTVLEFDFRSDGDSGGDQWDRVGYPAPVDKADHYVRDLRDAELGAQRFLWVWGWLAALCDSRGGVLRGGCPDLSVLCQRRGRWAEHVGEVPQRAGP